jgi:two-component SAPR family response regulator
MIIVSVTQSDLRRCALSPFRIMTLPNNTDIFVVQVLTKAGSEVLQAADGIEALSLLEKSNVNLIISDILMPG